MNVAARLTELGLSLPPVAAPIATYVPAVRVGDLVWTSGQLPVVDGVIADTGKVGTAAPKAPNEVGASPRLVSPERAAELARICALNALAAVAAQVGSLDRVTRVVKVVGYVASDPGFTGQPQVVNGASELFGHVFADRGAHARSAVGVAVLPLDSPVELDLVVQIS